MTERLYYTDPMLMSFDATVTGCEAAGGRFAVVLDRTAFYPSSGGQPFDTGTLGATRVLDVIDEEGEGGPGGPAHVVESPIATGTAVRGEVDWPRRFDHMQQHTGQHMLSAAFDRLHGAPTVSFHLGAETATIDLAREVTPRQIAEAERDVNRAVWEDRSVDVRFVTAEEASRLPLRKEPARAGTLRLIDIAGYDLSACGGTHVPRTGMVGVVAVAAWERFKGGSRVTFVCGDRALRAFGVLRDTVQSATRALSIAPGDIGPTIDRLRADAKDAQKAARQLQEEVAGHRAAALRLGAEAIGSRRVVLREEPGWDAAALRTLALAVVASPGLIAIVVGSGRPLPVVVARSADVDFDANAWMTKAIAALGGRGGGKADLAQGGIGADAAATLTFARNTVGAA
jgi:alanyl-tRNA synthetase